MKVLVACEFSGIVRDAFIARGHDAWSCDIIPTERPGPHIVNDVRNVLDWNWDLMIAHPPCTFLSAAGNGYFNEDVYGEKARARKTKRRLALDFFITLYNAPIPRVCIENPLGYANRAFRPADQTIHPYYFGDRQMKRTCLWLRGLSPLWYWEQDDLFGCRTVTEPPEPLYVHERKPGKNYQGGELKKRFFTDAKAFVNGNKVASAHERSRTFPGIAAAMADQWGHL
jgi:hypothetical protein